MPWSEVLRMDQRVQFIGDYQRQTFDVTELARRYGISRKTAYKWIERYAVAGPAGLVDHSRRPAHSPQATSVTIVAALLALRGHHPTWGAKKLLKVLSTRQPTWILPARSTVCDQLDRAGLITPSRRRAVPAHPGRPLIPMTTPNGTWTADFKGQFKTRNGVYCYPLTIVDGFSRYLLVCQGLLSTAIATARPIFLRLFQEYGLPDIIRTDNGVPFATTALGRLSTLSVWWIRLGILPELIAPASPQQNGRHERMHLTLKKEATKPPAKNFLQQQDKFDHFIHEFNQERPHQGLDMRYPADLYRPSARLYTGLPELEYPFHDRTVTVTQCGRLCFGRRKINLSAVFGGQNVGVREVADHIWLISFMHYDLGFFDHESGRVECAPNPFSAKVLPMSPE